MTDGTRAVVFLGPTLPLDEARAVLDAVYLPPARQGDLLSAVMTLQPRVVGLIDGVFGQSLSVWHKEILFALSRGVRVYGAGSLGALRAAETARFGTVGIGEVYRLYASGELLDDDEVALAHGDAQSGYRPASEPMVNLRTTFERARDEGLLDDELCRLWIAVAKGIYFPERTLAAVLRCAAADGISPESVARVAELLRTHYVDVKRQDAVLLLETIRDLPDPLPPFRPTFDVAHTDFFEALYQRDRTVRRDGVDVPLHAIADYAALHLPDFGDLNFQALNRSLAVLLGTLLEVEMAPEDVERELERFRTRCQLQDEAAFAAWLRQNDVTPVEFSGLMREIAVCRRLHRWLLLQRPSGTTRPLLDELRLAGRYADVADRAAGYERVLQVRHPELREADLEDASIDDLLFEHLRETECRVETDVAEWTEEAGFASIQELRVELLRSRLVRREMRRAASKLGLLIDDA